MIPERIIFVSRGITVFCYSFVIVIIVGRVIGAETFSVSGLVAPTVTT